MAVRDTGPKKREGESVASYRARLMCEAAQGVFIEHGYDGTSMVLIAAAAGVTKQTLYNHFSSKEELFAAVTGGLSDTLLAELHDIHDPLAGSVEEELSRFCMRLAQVVPMSPNIDVIRLAANVAKRFPKLGRMLRKASLQRIDESLKAYLDQQVAAGRLDIPDTAFAARYLIGMITSLVFQSLLGATIRPGAEDTRRFVRGAVELFCKAYRPGGSEIR